MRVGYLFKLLKLKEGKLIKLKDRKHGQALWGMG